MPLLLTVLLLLAPQAQPEVLEERMDLFEPTTGAFLGAERTWFGPDGRRLRLVTTDAEGTPTLLFFVLHDAQGRASEAIYFEGDTSEPVREVFTYTADGEDILALPLAVAGLNR